MKQEKRCTVRELFSMIGDCDMDDEVVISLSNLPQKVRDGGDSFPIIAVGHAPREGNGGAEGIVYLETFDDWTDEEDNTSIETEEDYTAWIDNLNYRTEYQGE
jgi:hypothetical protein